MLYLINLQGPIGAGKSSIAKEISNQLQNCSFIEMDSIKRMIDPNRLTKWRRSVTLKTSVHLCKLLLAKNQSVVTETLSKWPNQAMALQKLTKKMPGVIYVSCLIVAPLNVCLKRALNRRIPDITYKIDQKMITEYYVNLEPSQTDIFLNTENIRPKDSARKIINQITRDKK